MNKVVVSRHESVVEFLKEKGLIDDDVPVISHAAALDVSGKHVFGVLPLHLSALAARHTVVPLNIPMNKRSAELTLEDIREYALPIRTYEVNLVETPGA